MTVYTVATFALVIAMLVEYLNHKFIKIQSTIAITLGGLIVSMIIFLLNFIGHFHLQGMIQPWLKRLDFKDLLLNGMLGYLLFAGALTIDLDTLKSHKWEVATLALIATLASTFIIGTATYWVLHLLSIPLKYVYCLLFGAIISPTDPIAVLATLKEIHAPQTLSIQVAGESLFNDGIGLVIFVTLFHVAFSGQTPTIAGVLGVFFRQAIGGIIYGFIIGYIAFWLMKRIKNSRVEVLITLCIPSFGYIIAQHHHISGPLAMVVAGLMIGSHGRKAISKRGKVILDRFWEMIEDYLNLVLFLLIGFEFLVLTIHISYLFAGLIAIVIALLARLVTVAIPMTCFKFIKQYPPFMITILTWGGLRGGLALAMALSLPRGDFRDLILMMTYVVVIFAIVVQGLTAKPLVALSKRYEHSS